MMRYCSNCGRSITLQDARVCPYCGKPVPYHEGQTVSAPEQKKDYTALIIVVVVVLVLVVPIAIAATVYVYVSGMTGQLNSNSILSTPTINCLQNTSQNTLTVNYAYSYYSSSILWDDIEIQGSCNTTGLGAYITVGDVITNCSGYIRMTYTPTNTLIDSWTFT